MQFLIVIREILASPTFLVGMATLIGLLLQKKPIDHIVKGTVIAIVGFVLLSAGSNLLQEGPLKDFSVLFTHDFHIQGVIPNMEAISSLGITQYASTVSEVMFLGMLANLVMARFGPFPYIFLTGHHTLYMACLLTIVLHRSAMPDWQVVAASSLILGLLMAIMPALSQKAMSKATGSHRILLGHFSVIGCLFAAKIASLSVRKKRQRNEPVLSSEEIYFTAKLSFMRDSTVGIFIVMTTIFLLVAGIAEMQTGLTGLGISYAPGQNWITYAMIQGAQFSAAIYIILAGVRMTIAEIVPAFKGIAKKIVPHAKPAVDCPILFSYAPNAVMIGFLMSFLGGIVAMGVLIAVNAQHGDVWVPVIVPGVVAHFFCGGAAGVLANAEGGAKGCAIGAFCHGILISVLALLTMPMLGGLNLSGTAFSDSDFCVVGITLGNLASCLSGNQIFVFCLLCFLAPIVWEQLRRRSKKTNRSATGGSK